ncbi:MAG: biotin/lipoyl-binding protein [Ignavibacteriales bacterium]|nr:biotin/lipoyl-binding protein [Ignavibacteriales bacterium]
MLATNPSTGRKYSLGDYVKQGDVIIRLEDREYENNIKIKSLELQLEIFETGF